MTYVSGTELGHMVIQNQYHSHSFGTVPQVSSIEQMWKKLFFRAIQTKTCEYLQEREDEDWMVGNRGHSDPYLVPAVCMCQVKI